MVRQYVDAERGIGITNATAILVDTTDMTVKTLLGSADYFDASIDGQVNGVAAKRSPGSTLKPFVYALGLDQGVLHPMTVLRDVPTAFGPFTPENFDGRFVGPITAQEALVRSRNIPAVAVAARLAQPGLYDFLKSAGVANMLPETHYGLALVLGGGDMTMEELARLYAMLANGGVLRSLRTTRGADVVRGPRLLSAEAAFITLDMLRHAPRPDTGAPSERAVAWKTGTSWGFRDAWAAGVFGRYVLLVWVGNFDGSSNPAFIGVTAAAPLFFRIVDSVRGQTPASRHGRAARDARRAPTHALLVREPGLPRRRAGGRERPVDPGVAGPLHGAGGGRRGTVGCAGGDGRRGAVSAPACAQTARDGERQQISDQVVTPVIHCRAAHGRTLAASRRPAARTGPSRRPAFA